MRLAQFIKTSFQTGPCPALPQGAAESRMFFRAAPWDDAVPLGSAAGARTPSHERRIETALPTSSPNEGTERGKWAARIEHGFFTLTLASIGSIHVVVLAWLAQVI